MSDEGFSEVQRQALERAAAEKLSYAVRVVRTPDGRLVAILGETHMKLGKASLLGRDVVRSFELRGVEGFQRKQILGGRALGVIIQGPRTLLRLLSLGSIKGSTITEAKQLPTGHTVELERTEKVPFGLHVTSLYTTAFFTVALMAMTYPVLALIAPALAAASVVLAFAFELHMLLLVPAVFLRRRPWSWMVHPFLGILTLRDSLMAAGTVRMLTEYPGPRAAVVVMGRAHVRGYERLLVEQYGFTRVEV